MIKINQYEVLNILIKKSMIFRSLNGNDTLFLNKFKKTLTGVKCCTFLSDNFNFNSLNIENKNV